MQDLSAASPQVYGICPVGDKDAHQECRRCDPGECRKSNVSAIWRLKGLQSSDTAFRVPHMYPSTDTLLKRVHMFTEKKRE